MRKKTTTTNNDVFERYESISEFVNTINDRQVDPFYAGREMSHYEFRKSWYYTNSFQEADDLLMNGDLETAKKMNAKVRNIKQAKGVKNTITRSPVGFVPNIPAYLSGNPYNMFSVRSQSYKSTKVVSLIINNTVSSEVDSEDLAAYGVKILNITQALESKGYRLNIYASTLASFSDSKNRGILLVKIKDSGKPLNFTNVAYPLANPSFLRRHIFRWIETTGNTRYKNYGSVLSASESKEFLAKQFNRFVYLHSLDCYKDSEEDLLNEVNKQL